MYLVIKEIRSNKKEKQIPLRIYEDKLDAYNYIEQYMKESSGEKWHKELISKNVYKHYLIKQQWFRELKNGDIECLKIKYMKLYKKERN